MLDGRVFCYSIYKVLFLRQYLFIKVPGLAQSCLETLIEMDDKGSFEKIIKEVILLKEEKMFT
ncbi:MAG: hypothetical protein KKH98_13025 [Spirochaetes bacterium]|nr:hypothetical protein [Spirochaetota bacterium]